MSRGPSNADPAPAGGAAAARVVAQAAAIHAALFGGTLPARLAARYAAALAVLPLEPIPTPIEGLWSSPRRLAAAEYYLRLRRGKNGLSQRFQVLFYLAEIEPELFPRFARSRASWLGGVADLGRAGAGAPLLFVHGLWCCRLWGWRRRRGA